jgi:hypothetical protein
VEKAALIHVVLVFDLHLDVDTGAALQYGPYVEGGAFFADCFGGERLVFKDFNRSETVVASTAFRKPSNCTSSPFSPMILQKR